MEEIKGFYYDLEREPLVRIGCRYQEGCFQFNYSLNRGI